MDNDEHGARHAEYEARYAGVSVPELMARMIELQAEVVELDERKSQFVRELDFLRLEQIPRVCEEQQIESLRVSGLGRLTLSADMYVSVRAGMAQAAQDWLTENGLSSLIRPSVAPSTLKAAIKQRVREGEPVPDEIFNVAPFTRAAVTKG